MSRVPNRSPARAPPQPLQPAFPHFPGPPARRLRRRGRVVRPAARRPASKSTGRPEGQYLENDARHGRQSNATDLAVRRQTFSLKPRANAFISDAKEKIPAQRHRLQRLERLLLPEQERQRQSLPQEVRRAELDLHHRPDRQLRRPALHLRRRLRGKGIEDAGPVAGQSRVPGESSPGQVRQRRPVGDGHRPGRES
ncbi:MAG: hypothetical protein MZV63_65075 [Marinilabiliales bacterium]|nr:hypothetical protein [Marinilabiliales bacterium]